MNITYDHQIISSLLLYLNNTLQSQGQAYTNYSGQFYPIQSNITGWYAYAAPFKQLCSDTSVSGATVMTGVYLNGHPITIGQSGMLAINYDQGAVYFNHQLSNKDFVSGNYAIQEFSIALTDQPEYKLLYETKYVPNNKYYQTLTGLPLDTKTSPIIFVKIADTLNKPFGFGRIDDNTIRARLIIVADNEFQRIGATNIIKNLNYKRLPVYKPRCLPFDANDNYTGLAYNFTGLQPDLTYEPWILDAKSINVPVNIGDINPNKNVSVMDLRISTIMTHP